MMSIAQRILPCKLIAFHHLAFDCCPTYSSGLGSAFSALHYTRAREDGFVVRCFY
jgi:hypothetical protein